MSGNADSWVDTIPGLGPAPTQVAESAELAFHTSRKSAAGRARWRLLLAALVVLLIDATGLLGRPVLRQWWLLPLPAVAVLLPFAYAFMRLQRGLRESEPALVFEREGLRVTRVLLRKMVWFPWSAIESAEVFHAGRRVPMLRLRLAPGHEASLGKAWFGRRHKRAVIPLFGFEPATLEAILDALRRHLDESARATGTGPVLSTAAFDDNQAFERQLDRHGSVAWATWSLVGANVLVYSAMVLAAGGVAPFDPSMLLAWGGNSTWAVQHGQWWRLLSAMFLHGSFVHILFNMIGLAAFGPIVERLYGARQYLLIYLVCGLVGNATSLHFAALHAVSIGASGAIYGVAGAYVATLFWHRRSLPTVYTRQRVAMAAYVVMSLLQGAAHSNIDNAAHLGGLASGVALAGVSLLRTKDVQLLRQGAWRLSAAAGLGAGVMVALVWFAPPARFNLQVALGRQAAFARSLRDMQTMGLRMRALHLQAQTGRITEREAETRAQAFIYTDLDRVLRDLDRVRLEPGDPRQPVVNDMREFCVDMRELARIPTIYQDASDPKGVSAEPAREQELDRQLDMLGHRYQRDLSALARHPSPG